MRSSAGCEAILGHSAGCEATLGVSDGCLATFGTSAGCESTIFFQLTVRPPRAINLDTRPSLVI